MAGRAGKMGKTMLCSEATKKAFDQMASSQYNINMVHVGAALLKGSTVETQLYSPAITEVSDEQRRRSLHARSSRGSSSSDAVQRISATNGSTSLRVMEAAGAVRWMQALTREVRQDILKVVKEMLGSGSGSHVVVLESPSGMGKEVIMNQVDRFISGGSLRLTPVPRVIHLSCTSISTQFYMCHQFVNVLGSIIGHLLEIPSFFLEVSASEFSRKR